MKKNNINWYLDYFKIFFRKFQSNKINNLLMIIILLTIINQFTFKQGIIIFTFNILLAGIIVLKSKVSLLSLLAILANYPLIALTFQELTGSSYGILESSIELFNLHYYEINLAVILFNLVLYLVVFNTSFLSYESNSMNKKYVISNPLIYIFCFIAIAATIIYLPRFSFMTGLNNETRFNHLLPGNAWNYVAIVAILFTTLSRKLSVVQIVTYLFVIFWFFLNYERVDMLGLALLLFLRYYRYILEVPIIKRIKYKKTIFVSLVSILLIFLFASTHIRERREFDILDIAKDFFVQSTSCDIMHVFNTSFEYVDNIGMAHGETYMNYIYKVIPGIENDLDYSRVLNNYIPNPGGGYFLSEPYMNFGYVGIFIFSIIFIGCAYFMVRKSYAYTYLMYACLTAAIFRVMWYGLIYIHKSFIMIIPIFFLFMFVFDKYLLPIGSKKYKTFIDNKKK